MLGSTLQRRLFNGHFFQQFTYIDMFLWPYFIQVVMSQVPNIKFKTEYCHAWKEGKPCEKGSTCFFAHGEEELRTIQQNHHEIMMQNSYASTFENRSSNYKTIFCKFYGEGNCKLGDKCTYAHERRQKRKKRPSQQYKTEGYPQALMGWDSYQLYQYYTQAYMSQFLPQQYYYPDQTIFNVQEKPQGHFQEVEGNNYINTNLNGSNNIKEQLTFNQPNNSAQHIQASIDQQTEIERQN